MPIINHAGLSGGKDSTALLGWMIHESGYPRESLRFSFAETENEYDEVYEQIGALNEYCIRHAVAEIRTLRSEGFLELCKRKQRFPSAKARFCTEELKIIPYLHYVQELQLDGHEVIGHTGVRADESTERSLLEEWGTDPVSGLKIRRPLLKRTIDDVWMMHRKYKLPVNPLYLMGWARVGCRLCCMSNKADVRRTAKLRPWVIDLYREWEKTVGKANRRHVRSFFPADTVPEEFRSIKGCIRMRDSSRGKKGETYSACTIDDVVKWSMTLHGGKQMGFDFMYEKDDSHAPCKMGYCE